MSAAETAAVGSRVSYEDQANPRRDGTVTSIEDSRWGRQFHVTWDEPDEPVDGFTATGTTSDLRQAGWKIRQAT